MALKTFCYVDGFNLYYRALKGTPYKWLNLQALISGVLGDGHDLQAIKYYTADVSGKRDPGPLQRQQAYARALKTIPNLKIFRGTFIAKPRWAALADPPPHLFRPAPVCVWIMRTEEKGSDVNLASHLLRDAFKEEFQAAFVLSNDSDLAEPIRIVSKEFKKPVGIICPSKFPARTLKKVASSIWHIRESHLAGAQFPDKIPGTNIRKPEGWYGTAPECEEIPDEVA